MPRPKSEHARQKAIDAAQELLTEVGMDGFTIEAVAKRSGVAKTTLYRHWGSANELLVHVIDCQVEHIPTPDTGSLVGDLTAMLTMVQTIINTPGMRGLFLGMAGASAQDDDLDAVRQAMIEERTRPIREVVRRGYERGEIPEIDLKMAVVLVEGPIMGRVLLSPEPVSDEEVAAYVRFIARGLGATID